MRLVLAFGPRPLFSSLENRRVCEQLMRAVTCERVGDGRGSTGSGTRVWAAKYRGRGIGVSRIPRSSALSVWRTDFRLALRTNTAPRDVDEQAIPKSLERVIKLKEAARSSGNATKRKRRKGDTLICVGQHRQPDRPKGKPEKVTPVFQQRPGESGRQFMHRVSKDTYDFLKEVAFEKKYGVQIERDSGTGEIQGLTKRKREDDDVEALQAKHKNISRKKKPAEGSATLTRNDKRKLKLRMKKEKELENHDEFEGLQDRVAFGEVAHEPPRLKIKSKKMDGDRKPKNLLLNSLLEGPKEVSSASKVINRSGKRKHLSETERRRLEIRQGEAIAAYRQLKSQRLADRSS